MTTRTPTPSEKAIQTGIVRALRLLGGAVYDTSQPHRAKITPGLPDLLVFHQGRFCFVEVKRPGGRLRKAQELFRAECEAAGVEFHVWRSAGDAAEWCTK